MDSSNQQLNRESPNNLPVLENLLHKLPAELRIEVYTSSLPVFDCHVEDYLGAAMYSEQLGQEMHFEVILKLQPLLDGIMKDFEAETGFKMKIHTPSTFKELDTLKVEIALPWIMCVYWVPKFKILQKYLTPLFRLHVKKIASLWYINKGQDTIAAFNFTCPLSQLIRLAQDKESHVKEIICQALFAKIHWSHFSNRMSTCKYVKSWSLQLWSTSDFDEGPFKDVPPSVPRKGLVDIILRVSVKKNENAVQKVGN